MGNYTIVLDAGHGGSDPGAVNKELGLQEKDLALAIALHTRDYLTSYGYNVIMTREEDIDIPLKKRVQIANKANAKIFVSIHLNGANNPKANGFEVYHYPTSIKGKKLAVHIMRQLEQLKKGLYPGFITRGVRENTFYVLTYTKMPAILVEAGFITGDKDAKWLADDHNYTYVAMFIAQGIKDYFDWR